jgi:hypothetical protein
MSDYNGELRIRGELKTRVEKAIMARVAEMVRVMKERGLVAGYDPENIEFTEKGLGVFEAYHHGEGTAPWTRAPGP